MTLRGSFFLLAAMALVPIGASAQGPLMAPKPNQQFGQSIACGSAGSLSILEIASSTVPPDEQQKAISWIEAQFVRVGYPATAPKSPSAGVVAALVQAGNVVAAKMANDEAGRVSPAYRSSAWSASVESLLTIYTQPVHHASYPSSVRADGETRGAAHGPGTFGIDLEQASAGLDEVIHRAALAAKAMRDDYSRPPVRFYLLAHGFRDPLALRAATAQVCQLKLSRDSVKRLDISARMMAMPTKQELKGEGR